MKKFLIGVSIFMIGFSTCALFYPRAEIIFNQYPAVKEKTLEINISKYDKFHFVDGDPARGWGWVDVTVDRRELHDIMRYWLSEDIKQIIGYKNQGHKIRIIWDE